MLTVIEYGGSYMKAVCHNQSHHIRLLCFASMGCESDANYAKETILFISNVTLTELRLHETKFIFLN